MTVSLPAMASPSVQIRPPRFVRTKERSFPCCRDKVAGGPLRRTYRMTSSVISRRAGRRSVLIQAEMKNARRTAHKTTTATLPEVVCAPIPPRASATAKARVRNPIA